MSTLLIGVTAAAAAAGGGGAAAAVAHLSHRSPVDVVKTSRRRLYVVNTTRRIASTAWR